MYNFLLNVKPANRKAVFDDELIEAIKLACEDANASINSLRHGRSFSYIDKIDDHTVQLRLESKTPVVATRSISSITRALLRVCPTEKLEPLQYNNSLLSATLVEEFVDGPESYANLAPHEIVQTVIEIFFGQAILRNSEKKAARQAASQIKDIVAKYKTSARR